MSMSTATIPAAILIVDDEAYVRESLAAILARRGHRVRTAKSADEALALVAQEALDALVTDLQMPGEDGLALVMRLSQAAPGIPVIVLTGQGSVASAVACMKAGAFDYLEKPTDPEALALVIDRALAWSRLQREVEIMRRSREPGDDGPIGESPAWQAVMGLVEAAAGSDSSVVLLGESGSGKEIVAREIHRRGRRASAPFVPVNCAAIPVDLFESEFFGHVRGAFTGATSDSEGRFRLAHGGTLFLDEMTCLPPAAQAKLLRVLQDGTFERVGDPRPLHADVRVIAATNADVDAERAAGRFRQDLLYRLDVVRITLPPLRQRRTDIPLLAARLLPVHARRAGRAIRGITPEALRVLCEYDWPGNVRELQNVIERAVILERSDLLTPASLPFGDRPAGRAAPAHAGDLHLRNASLRAERDAIVEALRRCDGVRSEAARLLGIDPRNLSYYLRKHGIGDA